MPIPAGYDQPETAFVARRPIRPADRNGEQPGRGLQRRAEPDGSARRVSRQSEAEAASSEATRSSFAATEPYQFDGSARRVSRQSAAEAASSVGDWEQLRCDPSRIVRGRRTLPVSASSGHVAAHGVPAKRGTTTALHTMVADATVAQRAGAISLRPKSFLQDLSSMPNRLIGLLNWVALTVIPGRLSLRW